jgi:phosphatidate cytidylyltransferase
MITRLITGSTLLLVSVVITIKGGLLFNSFVGIISLIMAYESLGLYNKKTFSLPAILTYIPIIIAMVSVNHPATSQLWTSNILFIAMSLIVSVHLIELFRKKLFLYSSSWGGYLKTILLLSMSTPFLMLIRSEENGAMLTLFLCAIIWTCDTGAYFVGKKIGKRKFNTLSPNKTIEGSIGGILLAILAGCIISNIGNLFPLLTAISLSFLIAILAQLSDLYESLLKRSANKKDSSSILPGHGGFLDRCDSFLMSLPVLFIVLSLL